MGRPTGGGRCGGRETPPPPPAQGGGGGGGGGPQHFRPTSSSSSYPASSWSTPSPCPHRCAGSSKQAASACAPSSFSSRRRSVHATSRSAPLPWPPLWSSSTTPPSSTTTTSTIAPTAAGVRPLRH